MRAVENEGVNSLAVKRSETLPVQGTEDKAQEGLIRVPWTRGNSDCLQAREFTPSFSTALILALPRLPGSLNIRRLASVLVILAALPDDLFRHPGTDPRDLPAVFRDSGIGQLQVTALNRELCRYPGHLPGMAPDKPALMVIAYKLRHDFPRFLPRRAKRRGCP